mgnify:FL=1
MNDADRNDKIACIITMLSHVANGEGAFSRDTLTHAENVIEESKITARRAIEELAQLFPSPATIAAMMATGCGGE